MSLTDTLQLVIAVCAILSTTFDAMTFVVVLIKLSQKK